MVTLLAPTLTPLRLLCPKTLTSGLFSANFKRLRSHLTFRQLVLAIHSLPSFSGGRSRTYQKPPCPHLEESASYHSNRLTMTTSKESPSNQRLVPLRFETLPPKLTQVINLASAKEIATLGQSSPTSQCPKSDAPWASSTCQGHHWILSQCLTNPPVRTWLPS